MDVVLGLFEVVGGSLDAVVGLNIIYIDMEGVYGMVWCRRTADHWRDVATLYTKTPFVCDAPEK